MPERRRRQRSAFARRRREPHVIRLGYDLFEEVRFLLSTGQPSSTPRSRRSTCTSRCCGAGFSSAGVPLVEIPPVPAGHEFAVCLTHDIDFVGIRQHMFDHTMWGFLYRSTVGAVRDLAQAAGSRSPARARMWRAAASLPFVYLGWVKDFWEPFAWYLRVEKDLPATYFLIPFKRRAGETCQAATPSRRATGLRRRRSSGLDDDACDGTAASSACTASMPGTAWTRAATSSRGSRPSPAPRTSAFGCTGC